MDEDDKKEKGKGQKEKKKKARKVLESKLRKDLVPLTFRVLIPEMNMLAAVSRPGLAKQKSF